MVTFKLDADAPLTPQEKQLLDKAALLPPAYDEDSPPLTHEMEQAFLAARRKNPYRGEPLTLYVSPATITKAKAMGDDYIAILGQLLDKAVGDYPAP